MTVAPELRKLGATATTDPRELAVLLSKSVKSPVAIAKEVNRLCGTTLNGAAIMSMIGGR